MENPLVFAWDWISALIGLIIGFILAVLMSKMFR